MPALPTAAAIRKNLVVATLPDHIRIPTPERPAEVAPAELQLLSDRLAKEKTPRRPK